MVDYSNEPPDSPPGEPDRRGEREFAALSARLDRLWPGGTDPQSPLSGRRISHFDLERALGVGSFGVVYLATDTRRGESVALKLPRPEVLLDEDKRRRFTAEAELVATLDHPGIVPVLDADIAGPTPYIASEYVAGPNLEQWLEERDEPVPPPQAASFIARLGEAVEYAHVRGVVHRDLKPSNVMLGNGASDDSIDFDLGEQRPRLTDFGLAKHADLTLTDTRSSVMLGTPLYMAPEQFTGEASQGSPSTDVYALGVLLFELLTLATPHQGSTYVAVADAIRNRAPLSLRSVRGDIPVELERIAHKCLEKDPIDRYATVDELTSDLQRYLRGETVSAGRKRWGRATLRSVMRRPRVAVLTASLCLLLSASAAAVFWYQDRLARTTARFEQTADRLAVVGHADAMANGFERLENLDVRGVAEVLTAQASQAEARRSFAYETLRRLAWHPEPLVMRGHAGGVGEVASRPGHPDDLVSVGEDGTIRIWDWTAGTLRRTIDASASGLYALAVSRDGASVFTGTDEVGEWDLRQGRLVARATSHATTVEEIALSSNEQLLASASRFGPIRIAERTGKRSWRTEPFDVIASDVGPESLSFINDTTLLGLARAAPRKSRTYLWNARTGVVLREYPPVARSSDYAAAQSSDGSLTAGVGASRVVVRDTTTGAELWRSPLLLDRCGDVAFSPTGSHVAFAGTDGLLRLLRRDAIKGRRAVPANDPRSGFVALPAHDGRITSLCFPDSDHIATAGIDGEIRVWPLPSRRRFEIPLGDELSSVAVTADGARCVCVTPDERLEVRFTRSQRTLWSTAFPKPAEGARLRPVVSADSRFLATAGGGNAIRVTRIETGDAVREFDALRSTEAIGLSPAGDWLAACDRQGNTLRVWDTATGALLHTRRLASPGIKLAFSPDSRLLAIVQETDAGTLVLAAEDWSEVSRLTNPSDPRAVAFHPTGQQLTTTHTDGSIRSWNAITGRVEQEFRGLASTPGFVAYHPGGDWLVSYSADGVVLWDTQARRRIGTLFQPIPGHGARHLGFGDDGSLFAYFHAYPWLIRLGGNEPARPPSPPRTASRPSRTEFPDLAVFSASTPVATRH